MNRILLTNDDGWDAPGIAVLEAVLADFGQVVVVAPASPQSGISHQMTFESPMMLTTYAENRWHLSGTPADCTRVGLSQLGQSFDWVFSGINDGGNLGVDYFVSGTVAAAREATFFSVPAVAISQHRLNYPDAFNWDKSKLLARTVIGELMANPDLRPGTLVNVNLPDCTERNIDDVSIIECPRDTNPLPFEYQKLTAARPSDDVDHAGDDPNRRLSPQRKSLVYCGIYNSRKRDPGKDIDVCLSGNVSVTWES